MANIVTSIFFSDKSSGGNFVGPISPVTQGQVNSLHAAIVSEYKQKKDVKLTNAERRERFIREGFGGLEGIGGGVWDKLTKQAKKEASNYKKEYIANYLEEMGLEIVKGRVVPKR